MSLSQSQRLGVVASKLSEELSYEGNPFYDNQEQDPLLKRWRSGASKNTTTIVFLCMSMITITSVYSIFAPFFPTKAKTKGISEMWIGLIVSQYQVAVIIGSPFFGMMATKIKPKTGLSVGLLLCGIGGSLMGLIEWTPDGTTSIVFAMIFKTIEGLGAAAVLTNVWTIIFKDFPQKMSKLFATTEMCFGLGLIIGPALGGILYQFGEDYFNIGFSLPFWTFGTFLVLNSILVQILFPNKDQDQSILEPINSLKLFKSFGFSLCVFITINSSFLIGFNDATLDLHLLTIQRLSPSTKGGIFLLCGLTYTLVSQIFGYLGDKIRDCYPLCLVGCVASIFCFVIIGPLPYFNVESNMTMVLIGQVLLGISLGGQFIGSFIQGYREIVRSGFAENMSTFAVLAGIFSSSYAFGACVGPALGGYMLEHWGYRQATVPLLITQGVIFLTICGYKLVKKMN